MWEPLVWAGRHQKTLSTAILLVSAVSLGLACVTLDLHSAQVDGMGKADLNESNLCGIFFISSTLN